MGVFSKNLVARRAIKILIERGGAIKDRELYEHLRKLYDLSYREFISLLKDLLTMLNIESSRRGAETPCLNPNPESPDPHPLC